MAWGMHFAYIPHAVNDCFKNYMYTYVKITTKSTISATRPASFCKVNN